jgi:pimeloyl-ACP methyl ester carboxylesterase
MSTSKTHVYFIPGMAAGKEIFKNISLPTSKFETHIIEWIIPEKNEPIQDYAIRMAQFVIEPDAVLIGVSFGGLVAQEMSLFLRLKKLIIISSVKNRSELPKRFRLAQKTLAYKLVPTSLVLGANDLTKFALGPKTEKRLKLYQQYLHVRDKDYLDWAIENMVSWERNETIEGVIHLHGDRDIVFPVKNIKDCHIIEGGTHIMLLNKGSVISQKLIDIIENN